MGPNKGSEIATGQLEAGADVINGGAGTDYMAGGGGGDFYHADDGEADTLDTSTGDQFLFDLGVDLLI